MSQARACRLTARRSVLTALLCIAAAAWPALCPEARAAPTVYGGDGGPESPFVLQLNPGDGLEVGMVAFDTTVRCPGFSRAQDIGDALPLISPRIRVVENALFSGPPAADGTWDASGHVSYRLGPYDLEIDETITATISDVTLTGTLRAKAKLYRRRTGRLAYRCRTARHAFMAVSAPGRIFGGSTADNRPVVIELAADGASVQQARVTGWANCTDGGSTTISAWRSFELGSDGRFERSDAYRQRFDDGERLRGRQSISGRIDGAVARGRFSDRWRTRFKNGDRETCKTGTVRFTARSSPLP
jgi:hypothetical protein